MALLRCSKFQVDRVYSRVVNVLTFSKKLMSVTGMSEQWVVARIKQKGDSKCVPWRSLKDAILTHPDVRKRLDVFALSIYGLVVFSKALGYVDEAVTDLFDRLDKKVTPIPVILAETFRSLNACRKTGEGRFIGCAQLLLAWFHSHFWKVDKVSYQVFSENYSPLKEIVATPRRDDISKEKWMAILQNLRGEDVEWRAHWLLPDEILYMSRQFIPATQGIADCEFSHKDDGYRKKIQEMASAWKQTRRMKRLAVGPVTTPEYHEWWARRINDNTLKLNQEDSQSIEEHLRVIPSKSEIIRQDFERRNTDLEKKIKQMEAEKTNLRLDIDVQKLENEKLKKEKNKAEEELESQKEKGELKDRVVVLEGCLRQYRNRNLAKELKAILNKVEEMKKRIEELETELQNCEIQFKHLKANESRNNEQLYHFQSQVRSRDHLIEEAMVQIREVAGHIQTLAIQADTLSVKYELESDRGQELALLLRKIRVLVNLETNQPTKHHYGTRSKTNDMDQRMERLEQSQKEIQEQLQKQMNEQQKMIDKMMESQGSMMAQLTQWFSKGTDKGKGSVLNIEEGDNEGPAGSGSNPGANFVNPAIPDFDETAGKEKMNDELPKQLEEKYKWLEEKFRAMVVSPFHLKPLQPPYPKWYNANAQCNYHAGIEGHSIEHCTAFKKLVERLISMGVVKLDDSPSTENPLPNHNGVNMIGGSMGRKIKEDIAEVKILLRWVWRNMVKRGIDCSEFREKLRKDGKLL
ncbi:hypothetical protein Gotur_007426 [Gossypium turneri]